MIIAADATRRGCEGENRPGAEDWVLGQEPGRMYL